MILKFLSGDIHRLSQVIKIILEKHHSFLDRSPFPVMPIYLVTSWLVRSEELVDK